MATTAAAYRLIAQGFAMLADAVEAPTAAGPRWYSRDRLPPGCPSWRAAREQAQRLGAVTSRPGRQVLIDADDFDSKAADASCRTTHRALELVASDAAALEQLGVVLPMRTAGGRR